MLQDAIDALEKLEYHFASHAGIGLRLEEVAKKRRLMLWWKHSSFFGGCIKYSNCYLAVRDGEYVKSVPWCGATDGLERRASGGCDVVEDERGQKLISCPDEEKEGGSWSNYCGNRSCDENEIGIGEPPNLQKTR